MVILALVLLVIIVLAYASDSRWESRIVSEKRERGIKDDPCA